MNDRSAAAEHTFAPAPHVAHPAARGETAPVKVHTRDVDVFYGDTQALFNVSMDIPDRSVTAFIGPSGCGKSTFLRCINRMNDTIESARVTGRIEIDGADIYARSVDPVLLRARVGMVFQKPNPFPKSIYENVAYGPKIHGLVTSRSETDAVVETSLKRAGLWKEVADRLDEPGTSLSGGQQQRLVIARAMIMRPRLLVADEPVSMLDASVRVEILELLQGLQRRHNLMVLYITHDLSTARYFVDRIMVMYAGKIAEQAGVEELLDHPLHPYARALIAAVPDLDPANADSIKDIPPGEPPNLLDLPSGCRFHPRCPAFIKGLCEVEEPPDFEPRPGHLVACWLYRSEPPAR
jgi:phosphate transport system ATP-binding protein